MDDADEAGLLLRLLHDHRSVEDQLERVATAVAANEHAAAALWAKCRDDLLGHLRFEDKWLIPLLLRASPRIARTVAAEHRHLRARVTEIQAAFSANGAERAPITSFLAEVRAHDCSEEQVMYRWAEQNLSVAEQAAIAVALAEDPDGESK